MGGIMEEMTRVADAGKYPAVCHLHIKRRKIGRKKEAIGSGVLIAPQYVLTAAHNCSSFGGRFNYVRHIDVRFGQLSVDSDDGSSIKSEALFIAPGYRGWFGSNFRRDFALIRLSQPVEGVEPVRIANRDPMQGEPMTPIGYPGDDRENPHFDGYTMFEATGDTLDLLPDEVRYNVNTATGLSGGAVLNGDGEVAAVHTRSARGVAPGVGRVVDDFLVRQLRSWGWTG